MPRQGRSANSGTVAQRGRRSVRGDLLAVAAFLGPALIVVAVLLIYPIVFTFTRSMFDSSGGSFVGLANYQSIFTETRTLIAFRNNVIWVVVAPLVVTSLGLIFAVVSERIAWRPAFRMALFMPLVVSGLAAGVTFRFVYAHDPQVGFANAVLTAITDLVRPTGEYSGARPSDRETLVSEDGALVDTRTYQPGDTAGLPLIGIPPFRLPENSAEAQAPADAGAEQIQGVVWLDFTPGGGMRGEVDAGERGLPGVRVQLRSEDRIADTVTTDDNGRFTFEGVSDGDYRLALAESNFRPPFAGVAWLGPMLITPAIIVGYVWIQTGFALIIIGAGLAGINRELQDSARVEGAGEWQVFRFVTVPLLRPILLVVFVTTVISVLKIFDLVLVIAPESVQYHANVLALEMWRASFGGARDFGLGSALAALLFVLIIPAMLFNLRRFRLE